MREPFISLFLAAFPVLVMVLYNIVSKKYEVISSKYIGISSKSVNTILLITTSLIIIYCLIAFISSLVKGIEVKAIWPNNSIFIAAIIILALGIPNSIIKMRHSVHLDFITYFGSVYCLLIIIWRIIGFIVN
jgi:hypothetical protein